MDEWWSPVSGDATYMRVRDSSRKVYQPIWDDKKEEDKRTCNEGDVSERDGEPR